MIKILGGCLLLVLGVFAFWGDDIRSAVIKEPTKVSFTLDDHTAPVDPEDVKRTIKEFLQACPAARDHWVDVTTAEIYLADEEQVKEGRIYDVWPQSEYGWANYFEISIVVTRDPISTHPMAAGKTLHYHIGWGDIPGLIVDRKDGLRFCGFPDDLRLKYFHPWNFTPVQEQ